jgi:hypothetical protein
MRNVTDAGKRSWAKYAVGALALTLVAGVPALGLTTLGADLFAGPSADATPVAEVSNSPLTFDAPTATLQRVKPETQTAAEDAMVLKDFRFTASPLFIGLNTTPSPKTKTTQNLFFDLFQNDPILFAILSKGLVLAIQDLEQGGLSALTPQDRLVLLIFFDLSRRSKQPVSPSS